MSDVYSALFLFSAISAASVLLGLLFYILIAVAEWRIMVKVYLLLFMFIMSKMVFLLIIKLGKVLWLLDKNVFFWFHSKG